MTVHNMYTACADNAFQGNVTDLSDATNTSIYLALLDASHSTNLTGHDNWSDISADEITNTAANATGYSSPGQEVSNITWAPDGTDGRIMQFDGDNVTWTNSTIDAGYAVLYDNTPGTASEKKLLTLIDFEGEESSEDGDFSIEWDSAGVFEINTNPA